MEAVTKLKKKPYDDFSLKYWNLDSDLAKTNLPRLVAIMVGDAPLVNEEYVPVYNAYNGQTETMEAKWANLKKMEEETSQRSLWEKQISANSILSLKTGRIRVVIRFSKKSTMN